MGKIAKTVYVAEGAKIIGDVTVEEGASIWYNAVIRGDRAPIRIGKYSNVQDNAVIHEDGAYPVTIGDYVTIGHGAIVHGCTVGDNTTIGMGAIIMNGAVVGKNCMIGAGALITQNKEIPEGSLVMGSPAKVIRSLTSEEMERFKENTMHYVEEAKALICEGSTDAGEGK